MSSTYKTTIVVNGVHWNVEAKVDYEGNLDKIESYELGEDIDDPPEFDEDAALDEVWESMQDEGRPADSYLEDDKFHAKDIGWKA